VIGAFRNHEEDGRLGLDDPLCEGYHVFGFVDRNRIVDSEQGEEDQDRQHLERDAEYRCRACSDENAQRIDDVPFWEFIEDYRRGDGSTECTDRGCVGLPEEEDAKSDEDVDERKEDRCRNKEADKTLSLETDENEQEEREDQEHCD